MKTETIAPNSTIQIGSTEHLADLFSLADEDPVQPTVRRCEVLDISIGEYHSLTDSVSCSGLKHLLRSPAHFQAYLRGCRDSGDKIGSAFHSAVLEPDVFNATYGVSCTARRGKSYTEFVEQHPDRTILTDAEFTSVKGMLKALIQFSEFPLWKALRAAEREKSIIWTDEETGIKVRVRFDAICAPYAIFDLKSTTDARPEQFLKQAIRLDYDLQAAMYSEAAYRHTGEKMPFNFAAVETAEPHGIYMLPADESMLENGRRKFRRALATYKRCMETGQWPGYTNAVQPLVWPRYATIGE
jgi:hypothetical protein